MRVGIFTNCFKDMTWEEVCQFAHDVGAEELEVAAGALNGKSHCNPSEILKDNTKIKKFINIANKHNLEISSFACMGNYLHPNKKISESHLRDLEAVIELAAKLDIKVINGFAGCPGAAEDDPYPNWIALPYPPEFPGYLDWQWNNKIIPFWKGISKKLKNHKIKFGFEMHPGDSIFNTSTLLKLRDSVGYEGLGCCFDPVHLFWQGMDPVACIKHLGDAIFNVHAQDSEMNEDVVKIDGVFDTKYYGDLENRAWNFKLVGYGHGEDFWKKLISALRIVGYDGSLSIENQDAQFSLKEGFQKAVDFLSRMIFREKPGKIIY